MVSVDVSQDDGVFLGVEEPVDVGEVPLDAGAGRRYVDVVDGTDTSADSVLVDPFGIVFDSSNGLPVNGAQVTS